MQGYQINSSKVAHETIDDETIIVNFYSGTYYSTDQLGMEIWELMKPGISFSGLMEAVLRRYTGNREHIEVALQNFIAEMVAEDLVIVANPVPPVETASHVDVVTSLLPFETPILHKYTDMQDLLLLDPIHDVDEQGWPMSKSK